LNNSLPKAAPERNGQHVAYSRKSLTL